MHPAFLERPWAPMTRTASGKTEVFSSGSLGKVRHDSAWPVRCGGSSSEWPGSVATIGSVDDLVLCPV